MENRGSSRFGRRRFLCQGCGIAAGWMVAAGGAAWGRGAWEPCATLVLVQLTGGNDGLSTVVPHGDDAYHRARAATRVARAEVLRLDHYRGLHPALPRLRALFDRGRLAIVEGVGPPRPTPTHFEALGVWHTAELAPRAGREGWVARLRAAGDEGRRPPQDMVHVGVRVPGALRSATRPALRIRPAPAAPEAPSRGAYPPDAFGASLRTAAALIHRACGVRILSIEQPGFDTHNDQRRRHDALLRSLDAGLGAFLHDLRSSAAGRATTVLVFSEFGRRLGENGLGGTDHGGAGPVFVAGERVRGGLYGAPPSLTEVAGGGLAPTTDFRAVYATLMESVFWVDPARVLGERPSRLDFLARPAALRPPAAWCAGA